MAPSSKLLATSYMERLLGLEPAVFGTKRRKKEREGNRRKNPVEGGAGEEIDENTLFRIKPKP